VRSLEIARIIKMLYKFPLVWPGSYCCHVAFLYTCSPAQDSKKGNGVEEESEEDTDESDEESEEEKCRVTDSRLVCFYSCFG